MMEWAEACPFSTDPDPTKQKDLVWGECAFNPCSAPWAWARGLTPPVGNSGPECKSETGFHVCCRIFPLPLHL